VHAFGLMTVLIELIAQNGDGDRKCTDHKIKHIGAGHGRLPRRIAFSLTNKASSSADSCRGSFWNRMSRTNARANIFPSPLRERVIGVVRMPFVLNDADALCRAVAREAGEGSHPVPLTQLVHHLRAALITLSHKGRGINFLPPCRRAVGHARMADAIGEAGNGIIAAEQEMRRRRIADRPAALMCVDVDQRARMRADNHHP
jgi:hypothetical protein